MVASSIGGRLQVPDVLCTHCNNDVFGRGIDARFAEELAMPRVLLGIKGDREQEASIRVSDAEGNTIILESLASVRWPERAPEVVAEHPDGTKKLVFATIGQARKYVEALQRKDPTKRVILSEPTSVRRFPAQVQLRFNPGGSDFFRVLLKSVLTLAVHLHPARRSLDYLWVEVQAEGEDSSLLASGFTAAPAPWAPTAGMGTFSHRVAFIVANGELRADIRLFGEVACILRAPLVRPDHAWSGAHAVDPLTGATQTVAGITGTIADPARSYEEWSAASAHVADAVAAIRLKHAELQREALADRFCNQVFVDLFGSTAPVPATPENNEKIAECIRETVRKFMTREDHEVPAPHLLERLQPRKKD